MLRPHNIFLTNCPSGELLPFLNLEFHNISFVRVFFMMNEICVKTGRL